jgi:hypothetical protein
MFVQVVMLTLLSMLQAGNPDHMKMVKDMGIAILTLPDGRVQLLHTFSNVSRNIAVFVKQEDYRSMRDPQNGVKTTILYLHLVLNFVTDLLN